MRRLVAPAVWLVACCLALPAVAAAQLVNVSNSAGGSRMPHMALDDAGSLHVAWMEDFTIVHAQSSDGGQTFTPRKTVSTGPGASVRPRLAVHASTVHLVWTQDFSSGKEVVYARSLDGGATFGAPVNLSNSAGQSQEARVAVNAAGTVFVVWDEAAPTRHVALARSTDGGASFEAPRAVFGAAMGPCPAGSPPAACTVYPGVAIDRTSGTVHLVWHDLVGGDLQVLVSRSVDGGQTFAAARNLSNASVHAHCAGITVGPSGRVLIAWEDRKDPVEHRHDAVFSQSTDGGQTYSAPVNLSNGPSWAFSDYPWPVEAPDGRIAVGWEDNTAGGHLDAVLAVSTDGGQTFGAPVSLSNNPGSDSTEVVTLFGPDNALYAVWEDYASGNGDILLRRSGGGAAPPTLSVVRAGTGTGTVTSAPAGISCGTDCAESYPSGTAVTLTAAPGAGSTFGGWSGGGCGGTGGCTVTLTASTTVTATFTGGGGTGPPSFAIGPTGATPNPVTRGTGTTIQTVVTNGGGPASGIIVDLEVYTAGGARVHQQVTGSQAFAAGQSRTFQWTWAVPAGQAVGTYTVKIGVFSAGWATLHAWDNAAAFLTVQ
jgi:hypothetical protein